MIRFGRAKLATIVAVLLWGTATVALADDAGLLSLPAPGTYKLDRIQQMPFGLVRDGSDSFPQPLSKYTTGKLTLLTFFYGQCTDPKGCPLLWEDFNEVRKKIKADPDLQDKVRLVFFSFDPVHDTPQTLQLFFDSYNTGAKSVPWEFITSWNNYFLGRILDKLGEDIAIDDESPDGKRVVINHIVKVFLIDRDGWVREIYTSKFLNSDVIVGDIKTLSLEAGQSGRGS